MMAAGKAWLAASALAGLVALAQLAPPASAASPYRVVPVPANIIYTGAKLHPGMFVMRKVRSSQFIEEIHMLDPADAAGKIARAPMLPNKPVVLSNMREPFLVDSSRPVRVHYRVAGIEIVTEAVPLEAGAIGDMIRARSRGSARVLTGIVQPDGSLEAVSQ